MRIMILGGAGFGGSALTRRLVNKGYEVTLLDLIPPRQAVLVRDLYEDELINYVWKSTKDLVSEDLKGFNVIFDFAAQADVPLGFSSPIHTAENNIIGVYRIMECLKRSKPAKFIYTGSGTTFGPNQTLPIKEDAPQYASNPYSASKHCAEVVALAYHRSDNIPVTIIRNGIVYGEHMRRETVIARFITNALLGKPLIVEGGDQTRDMSYISNTLDALELLLEVDTEVISGETFHCATGDETSISQLAHIILDLTNSGSPIKNVPYRKGEKNVRQCLDYSKAQKAFGYKPQVFLKEGLQRTIKWFISELKEL
ncbi:MAG: NAD-dependent epimerase/dehydratase family protein, partial [Candidatus Hodarchaeota archaeon]